MRVGCLGFVVLLLALVGYGLYISWGGLSVAVYLVILAIGASVVSLRLKKVDESSEQRVREEQGGEGEKGSESSLLTEDFILQDPDTLLAQFRETNVHHELHSEEIEEDDGEFERAVQAVKALKHDDGSDRLLWIASFEQYTEQFIQKVRLRTDDFVMKRLNALFVSNSLLYLRVFMNLTEIAVQMDRLPKAVVAQIDETLANMNKNEYELLNRLIALHNVDMFLADHTTAIYFDDRLTKGIFTSAVMEGLGYRKQEILRLQSLTTDTEYVEVLLRLLEVGHDEQLMNLAKTAFENTYPRLKERLITVMAENLKY